MQKNLLVLLATTFVLCYIPRFEVKALRLLRNYFREDSIIRLCLFSKNVAQSRSVVVTPFCKNQPNNTFYIPKRVNRTELFF